MRNILLSLFLIDLTAGLCGIFLVESPKFDRKFVAISGGVMLGVGSFWMWPAISEGIGGAEALLAISLCVIALYLIDRFLYPICPCCLHDCRHNYRVSPLALIPLAMAIAVHNFFDGWVAGLAAHVTTDARSGITTGLLAHKIPEALLQGMMLRAAANDVRSGALAGVVTASAILLGGLSYAWLPSTAPRTLTLSMALASASFLFLAGHIFWRQRQLIGARSALLYLAIGVAGTLVLDEGTVAFR